MPSEGGRNRRFGGERTNLLADPAVDRRGRDRILHVPVGAVMLEADRRPHQAGASRDCKLARTHWPERQIGLTEPCLGAFAPLQRADDNGSQRPAELGLPHKADIAKLGPNSKITVAARAQFAEPAVDPALLAIDSDEAQVTSEFESVGAE